MLPIYSWTIRDISSDACWYIEAVNKEQMIDFVDEIHKKIFMDFGREVTWHGFVVNDVASTSIRDILVKHIKKSLPKDDALYELPVVDRPSAFSTLRRRSASGLRRTVSHMGNITRRSIPSAFRSSRTAMNNGGDREASSVQPLSSTTNVNIHGNVLEKATAGLSLTMVEESEQELYTAVEHSNKEN
ncbi:hypothetical protein DICVIV_12877 [Dictyocaulus viviparus]|uniref:Uncharacterized protein n=1 Tax=Dictyocaulus viviparus TaxID=29172 RepID=A0A0D8XBV9_DICVI|nr:hypothetical protein DICVIV_12877 [Dictyocaulus viviparus]